MRNDKIAENNHIDDKKHLRGCCHSLIDGRLWIVDSHGHDNAVFSLNMELQDIRLEYPITAQKYGEVYMFVKEKDNHIYLFPMAADGIIGIDRTTGKQNYISLKGKYDAALPYGLLDVIEYGGFFYLVPWNLQHPLLRFDGNTAEECCGWKEQLQGIAMRENGMNSLHCVLVEDILYMLLNGTSKIVYTDMRTMKVNAYDLCLQNGNYERLEYYQEKFWLIPGNRGDIISFTIPNGVERRYSIPDTFECRERESFTCSHFYEQFIWLIPWTANDILVLNADSGKFEILKYPELMSGELYLAGHSRVDTGLVDGHYLKLLAFGGNHHCVIDLRTRKFVDVIDSRIPDELLLENARAIFRSRNLWPRGQGTLADFMPEIIQNNNSSENGKRVFSENVGHSGNFGKKIWNAVKSGRSEKE